MVSIYLWAAAAAGMGILFFWKIEPLLKERSLDSAGLVRGLPLRCLGCSADSGRGLTADSAAEARATEKRAGPVASTYALLVSKKRG